MSRLTASKEDYIKTIDDLNRSGKDAGITAIAGQLSVTKASASCAVSQLERMGLAERREDRRVILTAEGKKRAFEVKCRFEVIYRFCTEILHLNRELSVQEADKLEHLFSDASLQAIKSLLDDGQPNRMQFQRYKG